MSLSPAKTDARTTTNGNPRNTQTQLFMEEVKQQILFPQIRSYLKLYTTIGLEKIARFNDLDEEQFSAQLVSMKHKLTQVCFCHVGTSLLCVLVAPRRIEVARNWRVLLEEQPSGK